MSIGSRIKERREELGITQVELAALIGVSKGSIGNYECGVSAPNEKILYKLFTALKCDANYLYQDDIQTLNETKFKVDSFEKQHIKKYRTLDEYGRKAINDLLDTEYERCQNDNKIKVLRLPISELRVSAGAGNWLDDNSYSTVEVADTPETRKADLIIEVVGDSMEPTYNDGDNVLVRVQPSIGIGEIGVFIKDSEGYIKELGNNRLISHNKNYPDIVLSEFDNIRCVGKVIGLAEILK